MAGYGAAVGVTTVVYHFELSGLIDQLIDDNPCAAGALQSRPGIPVVGPDVLDGSEAPDAVVILAWRYAEPIMAKKSCLPGAGRKSSSGFCPSWKSSRLNLGSKDQGTIIGGNRTINQDRVLLQKGKQFQNR